MQWLGRYNARLPLDTATLSTGVPYENSFS